MAASDVHHARLNKSCGNDQQSQDHHHRIAAEAGEGLVGRQQARGDHRQHHAQRDHVGRNSIPGEQHDGHTQDR